MLLKQLTPKGAGEIRRQEFCGRAAPEFIAEPFAVDYGGARMLLRDGGPTLSDSGRISPTMIAEVVVDYAHLQQRLIGCDNEAIEAALLTWELAAVADEVQAQAEILATMPVNDLRHITRKQYEELLGRVGTYKAAGAMLSESSVPFSLDHGDLWAGNVLSSRRAGQYQFIDLGDAAWTHPFLSMLPLLYDCHQRWVPDTPFSLNHPLVDVISSAYVKVWPDYGSQRDLKVAFAAAATLAPLRRSRAVIANIAHAGVEDAHDLGPTPWTWLTLLSDPEDSGCGSS